MRGFDNFFGYLSDQLWYYNHKSPHACKGTYCFYDMNHNGHNAADSIGVYSTSLGIAAVVIAFLSRAAPSEYAVVCVTRLALLRAHPGLRRLCCLCRHRQVQ